ncbi:MAG: hypothetical protein AABX53_01495 [Nanoarchaeota archaeon]
MNKQGLSDVVTAILIILIVLFAVGIIWAFLRPTINETARVASAQDCLLVETEPVSCVYSGAGQYWYASIVVKRGADQKNVSDIKLIFEDANGKKNSKSWGERVVGGTMPQPLEKSTAGLALGNFIPRVVTAAPMLSKEGACISTKETICERYAYEPGTGCNDFNQDDYGNGDDYDLFVECYENQTIGLPCSDGTITADVTHDGVITMDDFSAFLSTYESGDTGGCA